MRTNFCRQSETTLDLEAWSILSQCILKVFNLVFQCFDMLKIFILLGHFIAQLVVYLAFLLIHDVGMALVKEHSRLPG